MKHGLMVLIVSSGLFFSVSAVNAQQVHYMDSSGNIHFVDDLSQVPRKYRDQVITPTPVPVLDKRAVRELKRRQAEEERLKRKEEREKKMEAHRRQQAAEREAKRERRRLEEQQRDQDFSRGGS